MKRNKALLRTAHASCGTTWKRDTHLPNLDPTSTTNTSTFRTAQSCRLSSGKWKNLIFNTTWYLDRRGVGIRNLFKQTTNYPTACSVVLSLPFARSPLSLHPLPLMTVYQRLVLLNQNATFQKAQSNSQFTNRSSTMVSSTYWPSNPFPYPPTRSQLKRYAEATLGSGNLRMAVILPEGEDLNEWLAVNSECCGPVLFNHQGCFLNLGKRWAGWIWPSKHRSEIQRCWRRVITGAGFILSVLGLSPEGRWVRPPICFRSRPPRELSLDFLRIQKTWLQREERGTNESQKM